ncbi:MAG: hypothetical protein ACTSQP_23795, partial [Promethearchaeota archaeon]
MLFGQLKGYHRRGWYPCDLRGSGSAKRFYFYNTGAYKKAFYRNKGSYYVELEYRIRTLEHSHVIAVYENGTYSERWGRYYSVEKMAVIQIEVIDNPPAESPFVKGLNTVIMPSSAFLNSKLNSIVQKVGDANETEWSEDVPSCLKSETGRTQFQGIDRKNADDVMSEWIEILISKEDCSYIVAEQILNLT